MKKKKVIILIVGMLGLVTVGSCVLAGFVFFQYRRVGKEKLALTRDISEFRKAVDRSFLLPENEVPIVATVSDKSKLGQQMFFHQAENGDKVFIYSQSGKAILLRPSIHKIVEVAAIQTTSQIAIPDQSIAPKANTN